VHLLVVDDLTSVSFYYLPCLLSGDLGNLDFSLPVLDAVFEVNERVLLLHKLDWVGHVSDELLESFLSFILPV
jgi:hypothetical protein